MSLKVPLYLVLLFPIYRISGRSGRVSDHYQPALAFANRLKSLIYQYSTAKIKKKTKAEAKMEQNETELMMRGYGLTTAEIFYRMPDFQSVLNTFVWQDYDLAPDYPKLFEFIEFWQRDIEGPLHSVRFTHRKLIAPGEWRNVVGEFPIH